MLERLVTLGMVKQHLSLCAKTLMFVLFSTSVVAQDIVGDFSNSNSTVDSNNNSESVTNNYNATGAGSPAPVMSAIAPTMMGAGGNDSCLIPNAMSLSLLSIGVSGGGMRQDPNCNRRKNARLLGAPNVSGGLGLQVSGISVLCGDPQVFKAMILANTPCPINEIKTGKLLMGKTALLKYREEPELYVVGYSENKTFWDGILRIGEDIEDEQQAEDTGPSLSISDMFRSSKRSSNAANRTREDTAADQ
jgi:hypothetical protein